MGILGALFSGVSGLSVYSSSIEVTGNNIANANTTGFKESRADFSDILAASLTGSSSGDQIGRGVQLSSVSTFFTQGSFENTPSATDLAIDGAGFFVMRNNDGIFFTRAGRFSVNESGILVNARGDRVQGVTLDISGNPSSTVQNLNLTATNSAPNSTKNVNFVANLNASDPALGSAGSATGGGGVTDGRFQFLDTVNDVLRFNDGTDRTADLITNGLLVAGVQYTGAQVATAIKTALEAVNGTTDIYTVAYNTATKKFDITNTAGNTAITLLHNDALSTASDDLGFATTATQAVAAGATVSSTNQIEFNVVTGRNTFSLTLDSAFYVGAQPSVTVTAGGYTANGLAQEMERAINAADSAATLNRIRSVRVTYNGPGAANKFQIFSQTTGAARTISTPSNSSTFDIPASSIAVSETSLGVLGLTNLSVNETFAFHTGFNNQIVVSYDGGGDATLNLIGTGGLQGGLVEGQVHTAAQVAAAIAKVLAANDPSPAEPYPVTYNSTTDVFQITAPATGNVEIKWQLPVGVGSAGPTLGFTATSGVLTTGLTNTGTSLTTTLANKISVNVNGTGTFSVTDPASLSSSNFSTSLTLFDSLGSPHSISIFFRKIGENIWEYNGTMQGSDVVGPTGATTNEQVLYGRLWFNETGGLDVEDKFDGSTDTSSSGQPFTFPVSNTFNFQGGSQQNQIIDFDFGTAITTDSNPVGGLDGATQFAGSSAIINQVQDGFTTGTLQSIAVNRNGNITGQFTNGQTRDLARIVLANFNNPGGLSIQGNGLFAETQQSGQPITGQATTAGFGSVVANSIELSNVDLSDQFVRLIQDQQAFQANARLISTTQELLDEVVNLTR